MLVRCTARHGPAVEVTVPGGVGHRGLARRFSRIRKTLRSARLYGWPYRIRTSMCKVKNQLFELSAMFGLPTPAQTVLSSQKNNFLFHICRAARRRA